ncbi:MAG: hypothetical protein ACI4EH_03315 [Oliverpabstia sp.]
MKNTALITGSYGGLGTCFVNIHAEKGGDLILVGRNQGNLHTDGIQWAGLRIGKYPPASAPCGLYIVRWQVGV